MHNKQDNRQDKSDKSGKQDNNQHHCPHCKSNQHHKSSNHNKNSGHDHHQHNHQGCHHQHDQSHTHNHQDHNHHHHHHDEYAHTPGNHDHASCHSTPAEDYLKSFKYVTLAILGLLITTKFLPIPGAFIKYVEFVFLTIIVWLGRIFFIHAKHEIKAKQYGMMTLVSLGIGASYIFLFFNTFFGLNADVNFTLEIALLIWILLIGHYLEAKAMHKAQDLLEKIAQLLPKKAHLVKNYKKGQTNVDTEDIDIGNLKVGDIVLVKSGEKIPADGVVLEGQAYVNESLITGESKPIYKKPESKVYAGSICEDGSLIIKVERVGDESTVGQIKRLTEQALQTKPKLQRLGDKIAKYLTVFALINAIGSIIVWTIILGKPFSFSLPLAVTVLVIACPHALGIAIPLVNSVATKLASSLGIFIKDLSKLETANFIKYVVLDKTGTLTEGKPQVTNVLSFDKNFDKNKVLTYIASLEQFAEHPVAKAALEHAKSKKVSLLTVKDYKYHAGKGVEGRIKNITYFAGSINFAKEFPQIAQNYSKELDKIYKEVSTVILLFTKDKLLGALLLEDTLRENAAEVVAEIKKLKLIPVLLTGDNKQIAKKVAKQLGIKKVFAEVKPKDKYKYVKKLQESGHKVMMVGDGINDAAALTQADVGVAIGSGADIAVEAGDIVLVKSDPKNIAKLLKLAKIVYRKMVENVIWAIAYNVIAVPLAAGLLLPLNIKINPQIGAVAMVISDIIVTINALSLHKITKKL